MSASRIFRSASSTLAPGSIVSRLGVHTSLTLVDCGSRPSAIARTTMSRSVTMHLISLAVHDDHVADVALVHHAGGVDDRVGRIHRSAGRGS